MNHNESSISHRLDAAFRDVAAGVVDVPNPAQLRALAHPDQNRPVSVHLTSTRPAHEAVCLTTEQALKFYGVLAGACPQTGRVSSAIPAIAAAYKPTHGGYPSAGARA